jgi:hypothetical protein
MSRQNENALNALTQGRDTSMGINVSKIQASNTPVGLTHELLQIPSSSLPQFGSYCVFDIKQKNILLHNMALVVNTTALTGITGGTSNRLSPAWFWWQRVELVLNGVIVDTLYPTQQFFLNQILYDNPDRIMNNNGAGNYASVTQRALMASTAGSNSIINLHTMFDEAHVSLLTDSHNVQLRVYFDNVVNLYAGGGTGTPAMTINFANLICKTTKMTPEVSQNRLAHMQSQPEHQLYHDLRYGIFNINSGVSNSQIVLSSIVGKVAFIFFTCKFVNALTGDGAFTYNKITNFSILDSTSTNITSGQPISDALSLNYLSQFWTNSSYLSETATGSNQNGVIVNNGANVYAWSFSSDPMTALNKGKLLSSRQFFGNEQLQITWGSSLGTNVQVEVYAMTESILEQGVMTVKKLSA